MVVRDLPVVLEVTCCTRPPQNTHDEREKEREKKTYSRNFNLTNLLRCNPTKTKTEVDRFYAECDPDKENLCLYGNHDGSWEVALPAEEVPPELPEPALGINFARDGMQKKDWLSLVAVHSDAWLMAVAFYFGAKFDKLRFFWVIFLMLIECCRHF